jgi:8-oxo-dGTP diphosphatase
VLVVAALIREGGKVLLSRRRADQTFPGCWEFPGGKVEPGESPADALAREIDEELGCQVTVGGLYERVEHQYQAFDLEMQVYECAVSAGAPSARQVAAVAWFTPAEIPALELPPADYPLAARLAREG